ncbi:MAG: hypothetical protein A3H71_03035 [Candidatus Sungbacteria bacterium RIFCSPLOWO2_02_FULL_48_13b]|uniref:Type 4 fimbrial biogenesis protein PilX N-terminal domain-containing protein n=2 Tax=Candidatus Sungiibacteriota TaxID=1817917 RepID=A0A1G2LJ06_9BACT|nr:MAG: hypothetical protein A3C12_01595 [Candidatus Sungbacteria bacterium RIFCSPHIGHO2_02_FULL_49_20]OHA11608.1 MAG: hypothetical protein A3H71_03035 [Candidatus Sungbacteria bacterium RIFCSPLOWO2_02_FULL_48_13b]
MITKMQNAKCKIQNYGSRTQCGRPNILYFIFNFLFPERNSGITLLLVILVLSALMTISLGIFNLIFTELRISGELSSSFRALYAADQGMDFMFYRLKTDPAYAGWPDLDIGSCFVGIKDADGSCSTLDTWKIISATCFSGYGDYNAAANYDGTSGSDIITISSTGHSDCSGGLNNVSRKFQSTYPL